MLVTLRDFAQSIYHVVLLFVGVQLVQSQKPVKAEAVDKEVVIESGPVEYEKTDESNPMGEEDEFYELEEEDEEPVSAVHLMGHLYEASKFPSCARVIVKTNCISRESIRNVTTGQGRKFSRIREKSVNFIMCQRKN